MFERGRERKRVGEVVINATGGGVVNGCDATRCDPWRQGQLPESANEKLTMKGGVRVRTDEYIKQRAKKWKFPWQILKDMDTQARYDYLLGGNRLAILPSIMENSAYTVMECLTMGIPMVASDVGARVRRPYQKPRARFFLLDSMTVTVVVVDCRLLTAECVDR